MRGITRRDKWDNGRNIFHLACRFGDTDDLKTLLYFEELVPDSVLRAKDDFNWTPLHYACRFRSNDESLIGLLLVNCPDAVLDSDNFDRYPLHLACESNPSTEVVKLLLKYENQNRKKNDSPVVLKMTKHLKVRNILRIIQHILHSYCEIKVLQT